MRALQILTFLYFFCLYCPAYSGADLVLYQKMDINKANYFIQYDLKNKSANTKSVLTFDVQEEGFVVFDFVPEILGLTLNGERVQVSLVQYPESQTKVRLINKNLKPGRYQLVITSIINDHIEFFDKSVESQFKFLDMSDRNFLERYLPSSFESDRYKTKFQIKIIGEELVKHQIVTNGVVKKLSDSDWTISYPDSFSSSSIYFHLFPEEKYILKTINYESIDGRMIPVTMYIHINQSWLWSTFKWRIFGVPLIYNGVLTNIEKVYGPYPYKSLKLFLTNKLSGGMEYVAAAETSHKALTHEILHNYFGRSVYPIDGNVGWVDEAITTWNDLGFINSYKCKTYEFFDIMPCEDFYKKLLSGKKLYTRNHLQRKSSRTSYTHGKNFLSYINYLFEKKSKKLEVFLKIFYMENKGQYIKEKQFQKSLEVYYGESLSEAFDTYIYQ